MLQVIREAREKSDISFGERSVASFEYRRIELCYMLASGLPVSVDEIIRAVKALSVTFSGSDKELRADSVAGGGDAKILEPVSLRNKIVYRELYEKNRSGFLCGINQEANPLFQYPYIITEKFKFVSCATPSAPEETILKRSVMDGRIVHPVLASKDKFRVICAGEYSYIRMCNGGNVIICNTCSGHYVPKGVSPSQLYEYLSLSLDNMKDLPALIFTSHGWCRNESFKKIIEGVYGY